MITRERLEAEAIRKTNPTEYARRKKLAQDALASAGPLADGEGIGEALAAVYDEVTGGPQTRDQQTAAQGAADKSRQLGTDLSGLYGTAGAAAGGRYDSAEAAAGAAKGSAPTYLQSLYQSRTGGGPPARSPGGTVDQETGAYVPAAGGASARTGGAPAGTGGPTNYAGEAYDRTKSMGPGYLSGLAGGPGPDAHATEQAYMDVAGAGAPSYLSGLADRGQRQGSLTGDRYGARAGEGDILGDLASRRAGEEGDPSMTQGYLSTLGGVNPSARGDSLSGRVTGQRSAAGGLLDTFDPTKTMAVGDTYNRIAADSGPSRSEGFFDSMQSGDNIALTRGRERLVRDADRAAAAAGGFNSGQRMRMKQEALNDLEAKNLQWLGSLAGQADEAKAGRYATLQAAATPFDQAVLQGRGIQKDLATSKDRFTGDQNSILGSLATAGDKGSLDKAEIGLRGATSADEIAGRAKDRTDTATEAYAKERLDRSGQLDTLAGKQDDIQAERDKLEYLVANGANDAEIQAQRNKIEAASASDRTKVDLGKLAVDTASEADRHDVDMGKLGIDAASAADKTALDWDEQQRKKDADIAELAFRASGEKAGANRDAVENAIRIAEGRAGVDLKTAFAQGGAIQEMTMAAIDAELAKAGIAPAQRQANINNLLGFLTLGTKLG